MNGLTFSAASETLSLVLCIFRGSLRLVARAFLPLALVSILAACGGGTQNQAAPTRVLHGAGFSFSVPKAWRSTVSPRIVRAASGPSEVSVQTFPLLKPYKPEEFAAVTRELDRDAQQL